MFLVYLLIDLNKVLLSYDIYSEEDVKHRDFYGLIFLTTCFHLH